MNKRIQLVILSTSLSLCMCFSGCRILPSILARWAQSSDLIVEKIANACYNRDVETLSSLFSPNMIRQTHNFTEQLTALIGYYGEGKIVSVNQNGGTGGGSKDNGEVVQSEMSSFDITTECQDFRIAVYSVIIDTANPDNVGIWSLYIIRASEDTDLNDPYYGDGLNRIGIHLGIVGGELND